MEFYFRKAIHKLNEFSKLCLNIVTMDEVNVVIYFIHKYTYAYKNVSKHIMQMYVNHY